MKSRSHTLDAYSKNFRSQRQPIDPISPSGLHLDNTPADVAASSNAFIHLLEHSSKMEMIPSIIERIVQTKATNDNH
ncbi:hypothetical protein NPIL_403681 [Nephila pilipes]|uniref:Uncharacterized protein n=1 Tax=Nephila pilipes TaxID=299642 RepID=A0A8X6RA68_NEPPI|nr:hypothetical protein NPIL_403681 [Nephila pilipes]